MPTFHQPLIKVFRDFLRGLPLVARDRVCQIEPRLIRKHRGGDEYDPHNYDSDLGHSFNRRKRLRKATL